MGSGAARGADDRVGLGAGEHDSGEGIDELGADRGRHRRRSGGGRRCGRGGPGVGGQLGQGAAPGGHAPAGEHGQAQRERLGTRVQGGVTQLFVAGVQPTTGNGVVILAGIRAGARFSSRGARRGSRGQRRGVLPPGLVGGWVSGFWTAVPGSGPALVRSSGGARARRNGPRWAPPDPPGADSGPWTAGGRRTRTPRR
jgi:hypothetical protein